MRPDLSGHLVAEQPQACSFGLIRIERQWALARNIRQ